MLGSEFDLIKPFLRPRQGLATSYPRLDGNGLPYQIVEHGPDDYVGVCRETGDTITLSKSELIVYELDRRQFAKRVADAFGIERNGMPEECNGTTLFLGSFTSASTTRYASFLTFPFESADLHVVAAGLIAEKHAPFILMAPTRRWFRQAANSALRINGSAFVCLAEAITADRAGYFQPLESLDTLVSQATGVTSLTSAEIPPETGQNVFQLEFDVWTLMFAGKTLRLKDSLGLRYIAQLIGKKRCHIHAAMLKAIASGNQAFKPLVGTPVADNQAIEKYREQYDDLRSELAEAKANNDLARQEQIQERIDALTKQITSATGFGGRKRKIGDDAERARTSVTNAINRTITKIEKKHPDLARHLMNSIQTGQYLCYSPETDVAWDL